jgi:hypothetical protein
MPPRSVVTASFSKAPLRKRDDVSRDHAGQISARKSRGHDRCAKLLIACGAVILRSVAAVPWQGDSSLTFYIAAGMQCSAVIQMNDEIAEC